jgi:tRNA-2-methylthio-N6-dimethylallyladenosine synthase
MARFFVITFGCQMNQHDSERIREVLRDAGHVPAQGPEDADLVVLNTCSVRAKAEHKLRSEVGRLGLVKRRRPGLVLCVAGCVAQQEGQRLIAKLPQIDLVTGPDNVADLPALVAEVAAGGAPQVRTVFDLEAPRFLGASPGPGETGPLAYVTIAKGCSERCSFCVVPATRGPERYRPKDEILAEVRLLVDAGVREVTLLGQTVNGYPDFAGLLQSVAAGAAGLWRLRYTSPHPRHLDSALVRAHRDLPVLARHLHLPVQSGSDRVLRRMIRRHTVAEYEERVAGLVAAVPGLTLSTDVIVGFPGETRADFEATLGLVRRVGFVGLFGFQYSPRPDTPALSLGDDVAAEEKAARLEELFALSSELQTAHLARLVGTDQRVLVEGHGPDGRFTGRTERNEIVHFDCSGDPTGQMLAVRIRGAYQHSLEGEPVDGRLRRVSLEVI